MVVVPALENVDDGSCQTPDCFGSGAGNFHPIHGNNIDFGKDDLNFRFGACWAMSQPSELLFSFVPPLVEGAAACGLPSRKVSSQISEVCNDFDAAIDVLPKSALEPSSDPVGAGQVLAFVRCYLRSHVMQVLARSI